MTRIDSILWRNSKYKGGISDFIKYISPNIKDSWVVKPIRINDTKTTNGKTSYMILDTNTKNIVAVIIEVAPNKIRVLK